MSDERSCQACGALVKPAMLKCVECGTRLNLRPASRRADSDQPVTSQEPEANQSLAGTALLKCANRTARAVAESNVVENSRPGASGTAQPVATADAKSVRSEASRVCECPCGARFRFPPHMAGMRRRCRKCREPLLLPNDDQQTRIATAVVAVDADEVLRKAVATAVARIDSAGAVLNGGWRKRLSNKLTKKYSSELVNRDATSQSALEMLCDTEVDVVRGAITSLKKLADARSIRPLMFLGLNEPLLRSEAMAAVVSLGSAGIPELLEIIEERNPLTIGDSVIALGRIGDQQAVPSLLMTLNHAGVGLRPRILEALGRLGDRCALERIIGLLDDPDESVRLHAIQAVQRMPDRRAEKPILRIIEQSQNPELKRQAVLALASTGSPKAVPILSSLLREADTALKTAIVESLGQIDTIEASESLVGLLHDDDLSIVLKALAGMRKSPALSAMPRLVELTEHPNVDVRRHSLEVLAEIKGDVSTGILEERLLNDCSVEVRAAAARGLGRTGDAKVIPLLERSLGDESAVRCAAALALGAFRDDSVVPALLASLKDPVPEVRYHALSGLGKLKATNAVRPIQGMLEDPDETVRLEALQTLESLGVKSSGHSFARRCASTASRLMPDGVAGALPQGTVLAVLAGSFAVGIIVWLAAASSTASTGRILAVASARPVTKALWLPDTSDVILLRESGPADIWDAAAGRFKGKVEVPELESFGHPATLMARDGKTLRPWALDGVSRTTGTIKLPPAEQFNLSANGAFAVYVDQVGKVALWGTVEGAPTGTLDLMPSPVPVLSGDGSLVAGADDGGNIVVLDRASGKPVGKTGEAGSIVLREKGVFERLMFCEEGNLLAVLRSDRIVLIAVSEDRLESREIDTGVHARCIHFPSTSAIYAAAGTFVRRVDLTNGETQQWEVTSDRVELNSLSLSADETVAVASAENRKIAWVLNLTDGRVRELSPAGWPAE
ncbi:MAG: HEAT repeat protein [Planctomycetaceae bacterium]|jgi:HEAT repeat protein